MDLPPVQDPEHRDGADQPVDRLAAVEAELISLAARLEQLEASLQLVVREETRRASNEIRHTVSELGRRLALDLPQFLDRHRQLIVNEIRGGGATTGAPSAPAAASPETGGPDGPDGPDGSGAPADTDGDTPIDDTGGARRKRRRRKEG